MARYLLACWLVLSCIAVLSTGRPISWVLGGNWLTGNELRSSGAQAAWHVTGAITFNLRGQTSSESPSWCRTRSLSNWMIPPSPSCPIAPTPAASTASGAAMRTALSTYV